jgi:DNA-binding beta-propeller fold protein YncE
VNDLRVRLVVVLVIWAMAARVGLGQIFVGNYTGTPQTLSGWIGEYDLDGSVINPALTGGVPTDISIVGSSMYVMNGGGEFGSLISKYTTGGAPLAMANSTPFYIMTSLAVSASNLYVGYGGGVGKCMLDGELVNDSFITGLNGFPFGIVLSPDQSKLFVADFYSNAIGEYDAATGAATRETLIALADVPAHLPNRRGGKRPHVSCIYRWCQRGCKGIKLEWLACGGTKVTSLEALQRFFERLSTETDGGTPPARTLTQRQYAAAKANEELAKAGW